MQQNMVSAIETLVSRVDTILQPETIDGLLDALSRLPINEGCDTITLRKCHIDSQGIPILEPQAYWCKADLSVWQPSIVVDDDSLAKVWILSGGPPVFVEDLAEFALFTDSSREFYLRQGIVSLYRILLKRHGNVIGMLTVMWTTSRSFSTDYKATVEFLGWIMLPVIECFYTKQEIKVLSQTIAQLEQKLGQTEAGIRALAHDLKQPLASIVTTASLLNEYIDRLDRNQISTKIERVLQTSKGMNDWITSILLLAHARSDHAVELQNVAMLEVLGNTINAMDELIRNSSAQIGYSSLDEAVWIRGEPTWISHIWANLISNACKYGGTPPIVTIEADDFQDTFRFNVRDNGEGIPQDKQSLVFEPFSRFSKGKEGTGIGLTIVKMLVEKMGGEVGVASESGKTIFWFTLKKATNEPEQNVG